MWLGRIKKLLLIHENPFQALLKHLKIQENMSDVAWPAAFAHKGSFCPDVWRPRYNRPGQNKKLKVTIIDQVKIKT